MSAWKISDFISFDTMHLWAQRIEVRTVLGSPGQFEFDFQKSTV